MTRLELRHLRYFVAVAEELSFRRAAERLRMSQPPLSVAVRELETILGYPLLVRDRRHVRLTDTGAELLPRANQLIQDANELASGGWAPRGGAPDSIIEIAVPLDTDWVTVDDFRKRRRVSEPTRELVLRERSTASQLRRLAEGTQDIGLVYLPARLADLRVGPELEREFGLAFRAPHSAERVERIKTRDLDELLFLFRKEAAPGYYESLVEHLGGPDRIDHAIDPVDAMLKHGSGMALASPERSLPNQGIIWRPTDPPLISRVATVARPTLGEHALSIMTDLTQALLENGWRLSARERRRAG